MPILCRMAAPWLLAAALASPSAAEDAVPLPAGVEAVWDLAKAFRESTPTRERICLNGLWRWQPVPAGSQPTGPAGAGEAEAPVGAWGYLKVPACWPGISDYLQSDAQTAYLHPAWKDEKLGAITAAWYQRGFEVPADWSGRRIALEVEYLNSLAAVSIDGRPAGTLRFPGGALDLTPLCPPGRHVLSLRVAALPLKSVMLSYNDTSSAKEVQGAVARRGLCGDVWLSSAPAAARIAGMRVDTSVRTSQLALSVALAGLAADGRYALRAQVADHGGHRHEFSSPAFGAGDLVDGRLAFAEHWQPDGLWDTDTPQNTCELALSLVDAGRRTLDAALPVRFGFREFWIDGRDFRLNGSRIFLSAVPLDNAAIGAATATYAAAKETMLRLRGFGINCVYTHNYGCEPGTHLGFAEILQAADDVGMLVAFSQPHFGQYDWKAADSDERNGYRQHAEFYVRAAQHHPSVVFYAMSHNATGYNEDMNPDLIDGLSDRRDDWSRNNAKLALRAEAIVHRLDPGRIVYHHSSGNLTAVYSSNFYPNFVPIQELSDWFEHWATAGMKPMFTCEYGAPFTWDWTMYRGWYQGQRSFGNAKVPWEFCFAEWAAQFLGDRAFRISDMEKANLRFEAKQFRAGKLWYRWDYPYEIGSPVFDDRHAVEAMYVTDNWRAFRTWGLSANSPWEFAPWWKLRDGVDRRRVELQVDWQGLQRPGFSPDYLDRRHERMDVAFARDDWVATAAAQALIRNNQPLLAYLAGKPARFTSKDHDFAPGETVEKQLIIINDSRRTASCACTWSLELPQALSGATTVSVAAGEQARIPLRFPLPVALPPGSYELTATVAFGGGEVQRDTFVVDVLPPPPAPPSPSISVRIAVFDPVGETAKLLAGLGIRCQAVEAAGDLAGFDMLIVGKAALTAAGPGPDIARVRDGLKVILFEQTAEVLERRFGFRVAEYGLRQVFTRVPGHPALAGIGAAQLHDWRGEATILPPRLRYELNAKFNGAPTVTWCGMDATRLWRCGCRGNVASVLIEKPARGDFLPLLDGGFSLQYSPLLEYREGRGLVLFCQLDVTGRTESEPAAELLARNLVAAVAAWRPAPVRTALYAGDPAGKAHLERAGIAAAAYAGGPPAADQALIVGPGGGRQLAGAAPAIARWLAAGGRVLALGLDGAEAGAFLPIPIATRTAEHIAAWFEPPAAGSPLAGIGPADVHNRDPRDFPLVSGGAAVLGDGIVATAGDGAVVLCQMTPWTFDYARQYDRKRTFRRASFLVSRLLANLGVSGATPILERMHVPVAAGGTDKRWLDGLYLDTPEENDDPYRFFGW
jgi:hypothetical protein